MTTSANPPPAAASRVYRQVLLGLAAATGLSNVSSFAFMPSIFSVAASLDSTTAAIQSTVFVYQWLFAFAILFAGVYSDRFNKARLLMLGAALVAGGGLLAGLTSSYGVFMGARCAQAIGSAITFVTARAIAAEAVDRTRLVDAMSLLAVSGSTASMLGPFLGGWIEEAAHWRVTFGLLSVYAVLVLIATRQLVLPHTPAPLVAPVAAGPRSIWAIVPSRKAVRCCCAIAMNSFAFHFFMAIAPVLLPRIYAYTPSQVGMALLAQTLGFTVAVPIANRMLRRSHQPIHRLIRAGLAALALSGLVQAVFAWADLPPLLVLSMTFMGGFVNAFVVPIGFASVSLLDPGKVGSVSGFLGFTQFIVGGFAGVLAVLLADQTFTAVGLVVAISGVLGVLLVPRFPAGMRLNSGLP